MSRSQHIPMNNLVQHIRNYVPVSDDEAMQLASVPDTVTLKKNERLLEAGQICRAVYFVSKGCLRMYFIKENGTEQITQFAIENWWMADYMSLTTRTPSSFFIEAVEDTVVLRLDRQKSDELVERIPQAERYFRLVLERAYAAAQFRIHYLYKYSREELYQHFKTNFPGFVQRVPQYMLASYLGFTPEYLSELRRKEMR